MKLNERKCLGSFPVCVSMDGESKRERQDTEGKIKSQQMDDWMERQISREMERPLLLRKTCKNYPHSQDMGGISVINKLKFQGAWVSQVTCIPSA